MPVFEAVRLAVHVIWNQKMKSAFSVVGVFIGVTFLIAVVTIVEGMNSYMEDTFAGALLGVNTFSVRYRPNFNIGDTSRDQWRAWRRRPRITYEDADAIADGLTVPVITAWASESGASVDYEGTSAVGVRVIGATENYFAVKEWNLDHGRPFTEQEVAFGTPVAVLGSELSEALFGKDQDPLGRTVTIRNFPYRVIGVVEKQGNVFGMSLDNFAVAPALSPVKRFVNPPRVVDALLVKAGNDLMMREAMAEAEAIMRARRQLRPAEDNNFELETSDGVLEFWSKISNVLLAAIPGLVSISLVVGGIVIMNIMLMSVSERTPEIGIRKALGARRRDIMRQFLVESATLSTIGAGLGIATGLGMAKLIAEFTFLPASVAPFWIGIGVLLGMGVGVTAGILPARKASRLDPVDAISQE